MKRLLILPLLTFWLWSVVPAGANLVPSIAIDCDSVDVSWIDFPERPVDLVVTVTQGDEVTVASLSTDGAREGEGSVPVDLHSGPASAVVEWTLRKPHSAGPVTADLTCTPAPTTTTTTPPTLPDVPRNPFALIPPVSTAPTTRAPELPNTGSTSAPLVIAGLGLVSVGAALIAGARLRKVSQ